MQRHFFTSNSDGGLYDTRNPQWSRNPPLRAVFKRHYREITSAAEFKSTLRAGAYAWPGGYPLAFLTSDGALLCFDCARKEARNIFDSIGRRANDGWRVVACDTVEDDNSAYCDHCSKQFNPED